MKILVCTDGSQQSNKALAEAVKLATSCRAAEVSVIYVYSANVYATDEYSTAHLEHINMLRSIKKEEGKKIISDALQLLKNANIEASGILEEGYPIKTILRHAEAGNFDLIILGSRGLGGLKKVLLGSISNAVVQEATTSVLVVK